MSRVNTPKLTEQGKKDLENGYRTDKSHAFRLRCQLILLKSESRDSKDVASIVKMCEMSVNNWVNRYKELGIEGLRTKPGRGRKPLLTKERDETPILEAVKANRQRVETAKAEWEASQEGNKSVSRETFRRFLKALAGNTSEYAADAKANPTKNCTDLK
jgi:transposase